MKTPHDTPTDGTVRSEAARWVVRLAADDVSAGERTAFQAWLAEDPTHRDGYRAAQGAWSALDLAGGAVDAGRVAVPAALEHDLAAAERLIAARLPGPRRALRRRLAWGAAAGLAAGILVTLAVLQLIPNATVPPVDAAESHRTGVGERRVVALADGSTVTLNAESELLTRLGAGRRSLTLLYGEAFFEVAKDPDRPFVVSVGDGTVTAVGTAFNVYHRGDATRVTVLEGEVEVSRLPPATRPVQAPPGPLAPLRLAERQAVALSAPVLEPATLEPAATAAETSWRSGRLVFDAATLAEMVVAIDPYVAASIEIADERIAGLVGGGVVRVDDAESILKAIEVAWPVRVTRAAPDRIVLSARE